ncbi:hypothetical protein VN97_g2314 [Penicillium thymicola]|uniref:G protein-coupled receptor GPR1/2/3 C-terminal domain-containing protein n=1 Tax=Penicillium thymicola TaxID=293382 RepID=A0AAI9TPB7_PENTH|nr:hypothetical protein VN97_g2314 [Penicillium thymicola]
MSNYVKWLLSNGRHLQSRNELSQFNPATSPLGANAIDPLPPIQRNGLIAVSCVASVSLVAICSVLFFLTYRFIFWRRYYRRYIGYNQYVVLVYNLAIADLIQGLGFIVSLRWIATNSIHASDASCFIQGIWLQAGNPMSGVFVFAISAFSFLHIVLDFQLGHRKFVGVIVGLWMFGVLMVVIPIATVGRYIWLPSVAWCWITTQHPALRLWTHYFWIFAAQFLTLLLHSIMFIHLQRRIADCVTVGGFNTDSLRRLKRVNSYMVLYPVVYITLTLPLAVGRMASTSGHTPSATYFCVAGSMMALSGLCDTILYTLTRKNSILCPEKRPREAKRSTQLPWAEGRRSRIIKRLCPTLSNWGRLSSVSTTTHRSDLTNGSIPNREVERAAVDQTHQEIAPGITYEPTHSASPESSFNYEWKAGWEGDDTSNLERGLPRNGDA